MIDEARREDLLERLALSATCPKCAAQPCNPCVSSRGRKIMYCHAVRRKIFREAYRLGWEECRKTQNGGE